MSNNRENKPGCEQCQEELLTWLEHPLGPQEEQAFRERFAHCPDCLRELTEQQTMLSVLQTHLLEAEPSASIDQWILEMAREAVDDVAVQPSDSMSWWDRLFALLSTPAFKAGLSFALLTLVVGSSYILVKPKLSPTKTANFSARKVAPRKMRMQTAMPSKKAAAATGKDGSFKKKKSKVALDPIADAAAPRGNAVDDSAAQPAQVRRKTSPTRTITLRPVVRRTMLFKPRPRPVRRARRRGPRARRRARRRKARWSRRGRWQKRRKLAQKRMLRQGGKRRLKPGSLDKDAVAQRLRKKSLYGKKKVPSDVRKRRPVARKRRRPRKVLLTKPGKLKDNSKQKNGLAIGGVTAGTHPRRSARKTDKPLSAKPKKEPRVLKAGRREYRPSRRPTPAIKRAAPPSGGAGKGSLHGLNRRQFARPPRMNSNDSFPPPPPPAAGNSGGGSVNRGKPALNRLQNNAPGRPVVAPSAPKAAPVARYKKKSVLRFNSGSRVQVASKRQDHREGAKLNSRIYLYNNARNVVDRRESAFLVGRSWLARRDLRKANFWFQRYLALTPRSRKISALRRVKDAYQIYRRNTEVRRMLQQLMKVDPLNQRSYQREMRRLR